MKTSTNNLQLECDVRDSTHTKCEAKQNWTGRDTFETAERAYTIGWRGMALEADVVLEGQRGLELARRHACPKCSGAREEGAT